MGELLSEIECVRERVSERVSLYDVPTEAIHAHQRRDGRRQHDSQRLHFSDRAQAAHKVLRVRDP